MFIGMISCVIKSDGACLSDISNNLRHHIPFNFNFNVIGEVFMRVWFMHCIFHHHDTRAHSFFHLIRHASVSISYFLLFSLIQHPSNPPRARLAYLWCNINSIELFDFMPPKLDYSNNFRSCSQIKCILWFIFWSNWQQFEFIQHWLFWPIFAVSLKPQMKLLCWVCIRLQAFVVSWN